MREDLTRLSDAELRYRVEQARPLDPNKPRLLHEQERRKSLQNEKTEEAEERRHGEAMLASAHANRRANQALSVALGSLVVAVVAILQQCQGRLP